MYKYLFLSLSLPYTVYQQSIELDSPRSEREAVEEKYYDFTKTIIIILRFNIQKFTRILDFDYWAEFKDPKYE